MLLNFHYFGVTIWNMLIFVLALLMLSGGWSSPHANLEIPPLPKFGKALDAASASIDNACFVGAYRVEVDQAKSRGVRPRVLLEWWVGILYEVPKKPAH